MNAITNFSFENSNIRTVVDSTDANLWFVAEDVCAAIGITHHRDAASKLDADERASVLVDTLGGPQQTTAVSESGLYALIFRSNDALKPGTAANRFRKWVTAEVLPSLRKFGRYPPPDEATLLLEHKKQSYDGLLAFANLEYNEKLEVARSLLQAGVPLASVLSPDINKDLGYFTVRQLARRFNYMKPSFLYRDLEHAGLVEDKMLTPAGSRFGRYATYGIEWRVDVVDEIHRVADERFAAFEEKWNPNKW